MGNGNCGPLGCSTNNPIIDSGTLCCQQSSQATPICFTPSSSSLLTFAVPVHLGGALRSPGYNFDGTPAEDMMSGDKPSKSAKICSDPVFKKSDQELNNGMIELMKSLSIGDMEKVALEMQAHFAKGTGGTYRSDILNKEISNNSAFVKYHHQFLTNLLPRLKEASYDPSKIPFINMDLLDFSSFWDKASGLGITVHQVWTAKAEFKNYRCDSNSGFWQGNLVYTFYDHFGLDWEDVVKNGNRIFPQYHTGDFFKAWYILQHYRSAKPFITEMKRKVFLAGKLT